MNGNPPPEKPLLFSPSKVVGRRSSDVVATDDPILGSALRYIRDHACNGIQVQDVLAEVGTSRATLERRFADSMDRTPKDHIMQVRLQHVKRLLMETKLPLVSVARNTGFQTESHMSSVFKRLCATTPGQFRRSQSLS
ncbi:MAG: helix-turn-helix transcriptional regulator [Planctomycetes bacterium]|nr:helix-turn-helix transcriptional regulator [Planctomycetota bacterium]